MDRASQVLVQGLPPDMPRTYAALAEQGDVPLATLHHRAVTKNITRVSYGGNFPTSRTLKHQQNVQCQLHNSAALRISKGVHT